jgi:hypothetical protein
MAWSYDSALPTDKDKVRLLVGDTLTTDQQLQNEEITYFLSVRPDINLAAADSAKAIAARYARQADTSNLSLSISASQRAEAYAKLAASLEARAGSLSAADMFVGGTKISEKITRASDPDEVQPNFEVGQDDLPGSSSNGSNWGTN